MQFSIRVHLSMLFATLFALSALPASAAERVILGPENWDQSEPKGKEVDCIYGDTVLRNDKIVAVIGKAIPSRNANMTVRRVGGCIIDLTTINEQSDQLSAYYPGGKLMSWSTDPVAEPASKGATIQARYIAKGGAGQADAELIYTLEDGWPYVLVETIWSNASDKPIDVPLVDEMRADGFFQKVPNGPAPLFWVYDKWWDQAYGILPDGAQIECQSDPQLSTVRYKMGEKTTATLKPGEKLHLARRIFPGRDLLAVRAIANGISKIYQKLTTIKASDLAGTPLAQADVLVEIDGAHYAAGRTDSDGRLRCDLPAGKAVATVESLGCGKKTIPLSGGDVAVELPSAGAVVAKIVDDQQKPIPCKVQFLPKEGTEEPMFGPITYEHGVKNTYYSHEGQFRQVLPPGKYDIIVSHGPEYDAVFTTLEITQGKESALDATLKHSVETPGWISTDFHGHSSPSGDNTSSQLGRVLNLVCEHVEFAPCTEHNRLSTYLPHIERLKIADRLATCTGMELTNSPSGVNHHNSFPLIRKPHIQDNGAPESDSDPETQIGRLALWDSRSEKLVQQNHPDIGNLFYDRNGDGKPDGGFSRAIPYIDVIEVHPPELIFQPALAEYWGRKANNPIFNWLQIINQGYRIPGVVNTDAHYTFHGSGYRRNYVKSPTDDPAKIKVLDVVHEAEKGHIILSNGPYLEVSAIAHLAPGESPGANASAAANSDKSHGIPGDDLAAPDGKLKLNVRVQCPNYLDINRVVVLVNGRPDDRWNFTREKDSAKFSAGTVKFDEEIPIELSGDAHLIVAAVGEKQKLGPVLGPDHAGDMPVAVSNPIFVDVDGGGFKSNSDTLGAELPVSQGFRQPVKPATPEKAPPASAPDAKGK